MDWKYLLSLSPEDLNDDKKDELFNLVTWFDNDKEELNFKKCFSLFRISQELLKYKGEQVETLLQELDELATKQGEDDTRRLESDTDIMSSKSRKSGSIEFENLEQKYIGLKNKFKKQIKLHKSVTDEYEKAKSSIKSLESENFQLQKQLQNKVQEGSESDISETVREQHKELIEVVQNKNKQISDLLQDIEEVEKENLILRDKLSKIRDDLATATDEINLMTERLNGSNVKLAESLEQYQNLVAENEVLKEQIQTLNEEKEVVELKIEEFTTEINNRVIEWKKIIHQKDLEIKELRGKHTDSSIHSSISSLPNDENEKMQVATLNKILIQREQQILDLQSQLKEATLEMQEITNLIQTLSTEKLTNSIKIEEILSVNKEIKKQLKSAHERSQNLQEDVEYAEAIVNSKDADFKELLTELNNKGHVDLSEKMEQIYRLKSEKKNKDKEISRLVKTCNKLQENSDILNKENLELRNKLGMSEDEEISLTGTVKIKNKNSKVNQDLKKQLTKLDEENLNLKSRIQKLTKTVSSLQNQIFDLGCKPDNNLIENFSKPNATESILLDKDELKGIIEENEALRKGMHEILNSINTKKESTTKEIKSETLEQLLRALDVKHISGWYHPAMRLQAELHNLEGINTELREQLRKTKLENSSIQEKSALEADISEGEVVNKTPRNIPEIQEEVCETLDQFEDITNDEHNNFNTILEKIIQILQSLSAKNLQSVKNILLALIEPLNGKYLNLIKEYENNVLLEKQETKKANDNLLILETQLKVLTENKSEDSMIKQLEKFTKNDILKNRKVVFLEDEINKLNKNKDEMEEKLEKEKQNLINDNKILKNKNDSYTNKLIILENNLKISVNSDVFNETKNNLLNLTVKHRKLLVDLEKTCEEKTIQLNVLNETNKSLEGNKVELQKKLTEILSKYHSIENSNQNIDENVKKLSKKISESEVKEISERQRADHTNNLYELVKEQLYKSEERLKEFSKYNETILQKNLFLQEQLKDAEFKLSEYVDNKLYSKLQVDYNKLLEKINTINKKETVLNKDEEKKGGVESKWTNKKEKELLGLKHQIVDLIAVSDEKMLIGQLHSDIKYHRMLDLDYVNKIKILNDELTNYINLYKNIETKYEEDKVAFSEKETQCMKKLNLLKNILRLQKTQYYGCIPLISEEKIIQKIRNLSKDKHEAFLNLINAQKLNNEADILREQCGYELQNLNEQQAILKGNKEESNKMLQWLQEKKTFQLNVLRYKRQAEFKEMQLQHLLERVKIQDEEIAHIEEELLHSHTNLLFQIETEDSTEKPETIVQERPRENVVKIMKAIEVQTQVVFSGSNNNDENKITSLKYEVLQLQNTLREKDLQIDELKNKITEQEISISLFRNQIGDKQSQITFYERHILELQSKNLETNKDMFDGAGGDNISVGRASFSKEDELLSLKSIVDKMQETLSLKEKAIQDYESLLKNDRDKHSLAAARLQDEIKVLQKGILEEKQKNTQLDDCLQSSKPNRAAMEEYVNQVHSLEKHTAELHTSVSSLEAQLQTSREEAVRWKTLASDRLQAMNDLHKDLEDQHKNELSMYKEDCDKWKEEVNNLKDMIVKHRSETGNIGGDIQKIMKEKDNRIHELSVLLRQAKSNKAEKTPEMDLTPKLTNLESTNETLQKENELLRKKYEQLMQRERNIREEVRELKGQLMKKPIISAKSDKSEKSIKDQLQRKISTLENEIIQLKENLSAQIAINETHKVKSDEDFERWKKLKYWQQTTEKLKSKLNEKDLKLTRLQQTTSGYRMLIERLEREKHNLENRIKNLKTDCNKSNDETIEMLRIENMKLLAENQSLISKLEISQHHAGGLGVSLLQEKLEGQERKIAVLEVSAKGSVEVRGEMERMQSKISSIQKRNLCLEAENLECKMDLEKSRKEMPYLQEQIQHLENYIEVLKDENTKNLSGRGAEKSSEQNCESKKLPELERTVFILKRVIEKLQVENKRLINGKMPNSERTSSADKFRRDNLRLRQQYGEAIEKVTLLEKELADCNDKIKSFSKKPVSDIVKALSEELSNVRKELKEKSLLLERVKILLQRAAAKEKSLLQEIANMRK
ncbi:unnamed protein product [Brassicogethes aeneus]|uniref:Centrosomal protein of 290 kDa n=1 Tax=Brassicogethes aeneus TaxID=1431903 RepID=A0A9P0B1J9_BRAAE|nr:unnamed protein product [Brassicogethes aeneus]